MPVVPVQILPVGVLAAVHNETHGIQTGTKPEFRVRRPPIFLKQAQSGQRPGGFITMNPGAQVKTGRVSRANGRGPVQGKKVEFALSAENLQGPPVLLGGGFDVT
jgi:hypothetical protein